MGTQKIDRTKVIDLRSATYEERLELKNVLLDNGESILDGTDVFREYNPYPYLIWYDNSWGGTSTSLRDLIPYQDLLTPILDLKDIYG